MAKKIRQYTRLLQNTRGAIKKLREDERNVRASRVEIDRLLSAMKKNTEFNYDPYIANKTIYIRGQVTGVDGFKDRRVLRALEKIEATGSVEFKRSNDSPEYMERTFIAEGKVGEFDVYLAVEVKLKAAPKNCRRVQVGVDRAITETPRYEFVCA